MKAIKLFVAAAALAVTGSAFAEFKAEVKTEIKADKVNQIGLAAGQKAVVQNSVGGVATNGIKDANIKLDSKIEAKSINQIGLAAGKSSVVQNNLGAVTANK